MNELEKCPACGAEMCVNDYYAKHGHGDRVYASHPENDPTCPMYRAADDSITPEEWNSLVRTIRYNVAVMVVAAIEARWIADGKVAGCKGYKECTEDELESLKQQSEAK